MSWSPKQRTSTSMHFASAWLEVLDVNTGSTVNVWRILLAEERDFLHVCPNSICSAPRKVLELLRACPQPGKAADMKTSISVSGLWSSGGKTSDGCGGVRKGGCAWEPEHPASCSRKILSSGCIRPRH